MSQWNKNPLVAAILLMALVTVAYLPALQCGYVWDDDHYVTDNSMLSSPQGLKEIWFSAHSHSQYFPLVYTTLRYEYQLWGLNPMGYHAVNVFFHAVNAVLVWILLKRLRVPGAWLAAAIFGLHPVQVESVAWISELKNVESGCFYLLTLLIWIRFSETEGRSSWPMYWLALATYMLALFAKTTACTLPAAMVLVLWLRGQRISWQRGFQIIPFFILGIGLGLLSVWWEKHLGNLDERYGLALNGLQRTLLAGRGLWFYAGKIFWPVGFSFSYPHWEISTRSFWQYAPLAGCMALAALLWRWRERTGPGLLVGVAFFVAALSPMLGFINEFTFFYTYVADHYQYNAALGLMAIFAALMTRWLEKSPYRLVISVSLLCLLGSLTWQQCHAYRNAETLWRDTLAKNPDSWMAHHNLGIELMAQGQIDEALEHYEAAVAQYPEGDQEQSDLGTGLMEKGRFPEAIQHFQKALMLNPGLFPAQNNLAMTYFRSGQDDLAVIHYGKALQLQSNSVGVYMNLGTVLQHQGKQDAALENYREALKHVPSDPVLLRRMTGMLMEKGLHEQAIEVYQQAIRRASGQVDLMLDLGNLHLTLTNYAAAADCYRRAIKMEPANAGLHYNLGITEGLLRHTEVERRELMESLRLKPDFTQAAEQLSQMNQNQNH